MTINEVIVYFPAPEEDNIHHIIRNTSDDESNEAETQIDEFEQEESSDVPDEDRAASQQNEEDQFSDTEEFTVEKVVDHKRNKSRKHRYAKYGETLFLLRWYDYASITDTWEPIIHLPRSKFIEYFKRNKIPLADNLNGAIDG